MTLYDSIVHIRRLLDLLPRVRVVGEQWSDAQTMLVLHVAAHDSLVTLTRCCWDVTLVLSVEPAEFYRDEASPPGFDELRYVIRIPRAIDCAEEFGSALVRDLFKRGLIDPAEAKTLVGSWNRTLDKVSQWD